MIRFRTASDGSFHLGNMQSKMQASVGNTIECARDNPAIKSISINFHTPFEGTEYLALGLEKRSEIIDRIIAYKKKGFCDSISAILRLNSSEFPFKPDTIFAGLKLRG